MSTLVELLPGKWTLTGIFTFRRGLFGGAVLYVEEYRKERAVEWRLVGNGYQPTDWVARARWRKATLWEAYQITIHKALGEPAAAPKGIG
ncbi:MAG TPA: hypothetical protein PLT25_02180 [Acidocella sp.]|nr:hypothetical protein [Acidocella sp.]